ncbi:UDP-N-acetylglucosamine 2-epimerase (non-hydrolyzing) [soil metagenome]
MPIKIVNVVGARPNFIKIAPLMAAFRSRREFQPLLVHTGQHYDPRMSALFFDELEIPKPDINLGVGSGTAAQQTAAIMTAFEPLVLEHKPDAVVVVGDVTSTVACGLVAVKLGVKLIHVEAGLRSGDRTMPEEINRIVTDSISDLLFCTEQSGVDHLRREGVAENRIHLVGNVMIDTLLRNRDKAAASTILESLKLHPKQYALVTLHRPSNVDDEPTFARLLDALQVIQRDLTIVLPIHPRTRKNLARPALQARIDAMNNLRIIDPAGYLDFMHLMSHAKLILTDSGGIQEEATILRTPCLTLRENTERPVTVECGANRIVGTQPENILRAYRAIMNGQARAPQTPPLWDGQAATRIVEVLARELCR